MYIRYVSVFYNPIIFANVIILLWPIAITFEPFKIKKNLKVIFLMRTTIILLSLISILLTDSRGGILVFMIQMFWLLTKLKSNVYITNNIRYTAYFIILMVITIVFINIDFLLETVLRRFIESNPLDKGSSAFERLQGAFGGLELGSNNLFFGVGLGNFKQAYLSTSAASNALLELESAHNFIINLFAETGLFITATWILIITIPLNRIRVARVWLHSKNKDSLYIALITSIAGYTATQFLFYGEFLHKNVGLPMVLYFIILALASSLYFMKKNEDSHA
jgi:hypothetical protein